VTDQQGTKRPDSRPTDADNTTRIDGRDNVTDTQTIASTPAEELRAAATKLRETAANATPGPWENAENDLWIGGPVWGYQVTKDGTFIGEDSAWIALMHPGLAEPLAEWLDSEANRRHTATAHHHRGILGGYSGHCSCGDSVIQPDPEIPAQCGRLRKALAVARVINGSAS
jgi:hypothetical protein